MAGERRNTAVARSVPAEPRASWATPTDPYRDRAAHRGRTCARELRVLARRRRASLLDSPYAAFLFDTQHRATASTSPAPWPRCCASTASRRGWRWASPPATRTRTAGSSSAGTTRTPGWRRTSRAWAGCRSTPRRVGRCREPASPRRTPASRIPSRRWRRARAPAAPGAPPRRACVASTRTPSRPNRGGRHRERGFAGLDVAAGHCGRRRRARRMATRTRSAAQNPAAPRRPGAPPAGGRRAHRRRPARLRPGPGAFADARRDRGLRKGAGRDRRHRARRPGPSRAFWRPRDGR